MINRLIGVCFFVWCILLTILVVPVSATDYNVGVTPGQYVKFGNYVGNGSLSFYSEIDWVRFEVTTVVGKNITLLGTGLMKNGTAFPGNGSLLVIDIENGGTGARIIAANLDQGDVIPDLQPGAVINVTRTENRNYFGITRAVNVVDYTSTSGGTTYINSIVFDKATGFNLEVQLKLTSTTQTSTGSYIVTETNIFTGVPIPELPTFLTLFMVMMTATATIMFFKKTKFSTNK